jgi:SAM-dependent methyltransferase
LPQGVSPGTWDYVNDAWIASNYNLMHAKHPLLELDRQIIQSHLATEASNDPASRVAVDFGCGTGRNLIPLAMSGWQVIGVDLSQRMLEEFATTARSHSIESRCTQIQANMVEKTSLPDESADAVLCMFSSFGMIAGRSNRLAFLANVRQLLKPNGQFFVHVHNRGSWLRDPGGIKKTVRDWWRSCRDRHWELGDHIYPYLGLPSMYLHIYSEPEFKRDLRQSKLTISRFYRLDRESKSILKSSWLSHIRSGGFLAVCKR